MRKVLFNGSANDEGSSDGSNDGRVYSSHNHWHGPTAAPKKKDCDHVIVSSGWWSCQAGRVEGGNSGTRDELGALHSALREQTPPVPRKRWEQPVTAASSLQLLEGEHLFAD